MPLHVVVRFRGRHPGIDMASRAEPLGADVSIDEIRDFIGCDSLHYPARRVDRRDAERARWPLHRVLQRGDNLPVSGAYEQFAQTKFDFDAASGAT